MKIVKRNGDTVKFSKDKIVSAIRKANESVEEELRISEEKIAEIAKSIEDIAKSVDTPLLVEQIQDLVETKIQEAGAYGLAKSYIKYRYIRQKIREDNILREKLTASNVQNQNANVDEHSFGGRMGETISFITKQYAIEHLLSKKSARNHNNNEIYIHDLDSYSVGSHNCLSIPFDKLLADGFNTRQCDVRPAGSINTAMQLVAVIFQLQSLQQFGGVSATHLDWTMVPYVRLSFFKHYKDGLKYVSKKILETVYPKEKIKETSITDRGFYNDDSACEYAIDKTKDELSQAVEGMYHNLNTLQSRSGNQLPFTSINYGTCTLPEGRMVIRALLEGSIKGVGKFGKTPIFPCGIFQCMNGVNRKEGDANYDLFLLALKSTSLRLYPNYAYVQWSGNKGFDPENPSTYFSTMGCVSLDAKISVMVDGEYAEITIGDFWEFCHNRFGYKNQAELGYSDTGFYSDLEGVFIKDKDGYVKCNRIIKNTNNPLVFDNGKLTKWYLIQLESGKYVKCTADHPWTLKRGDEILAENVKIGDIAFSLNEDGRLVEDKVVEIKIISEDPKRVDESFDVSTESEHFIVNGIYTHNCRTANGYDINADDPKLVQLKDGRGNICPVTLILPELAMKAKKKLGKELAKEGNEAIAKKEYESRLKTMFLTILDQKINEAKDMLLERFEWICSQSPKSARFMYENGTMYGYKPEEGIRSALRHGTLAIGQLGLAETLQILIGCDHTETKGLDFAKVIEQKFKDRCLEFKNKYRLNFGVYYTPAENLCYTAMKKFKAKHGVIEKVSDRDFFTNSIHCPVWKKLTPFEKIDIESQLTGYSSAGCITYVEMDSSTKNNIEALEKLVNYAMDKDIPYFAINIPNDTCDECGYTGDIARECPKCGSTKIQRLRRVTGYLTGDYKTAFNKGKQEETESRVKHVSVEA